MKKNLKKVISAVVAFALTASSAAFAAAPSFTDVADTASYADSVKTLTALGVISGYEDGTFKPDDKITRAEVSTMIVAAINRTADAQGQMGNTKFADMNNEAKKWASGYVNVAVSEDIIAGFEDGTFRPDEQVTYAQVVKMLVCAAGYGQYASYLGGWPNGYLSVASDKGITAGVSAGQDEAVTRAQVAQLIYNTLDVPMVASNGFSISETTGAVVPSLKVMDGKEDRDYQTLLTEKHRAYKVEGLVTATNRTNSAECDADEVKFEIQYTENYDDSDIVVKKNQADNFTYPTDIINVGDTDAADYLLTYATGIVKFDENDDPTFVSFVPSGKNKVEEFDASLVMYDTAANADNKDAYHFVNGDSNFLKFYPTKSSSKATKYSLEKDFKDIKIYVNGVKVDTDEANLKKYVLTNTTGKVQLVDTYSATSKANGYYDVIFATYYVTGKVDSVNNSSKKIVLKDSKPSGVSAITLDTEADDELVYSITLNGETVELASLKEDDIVSIAYDVTQNAKDSKFYEILVSRDVAEGKYTGKSSDDETFTIGGTAYEAVDFDGLELVLSDEYTVYLDAFGRIYDAEKLQSSAKFAIVDKYTKASSDDYYKATLYTADGSSKGVQLDTSKAKLYMTQKAKDNPKANASDIYTGKAIDDKMKELVYGSTTSTDSKTDVQNRVVSYKISASTGYITELVVIAPVFGASKEDNGKTVVDSADYRETTKTIGAVKMSATTKVIDAIDYVGKATPSTSDLKTSSITAFVDDTGYKAFGYDKGTDGTFSLVVVVEGDGTYTSDTMLAVVTKTPEKGTADNEDEYRITALYGKETADDKKAEKELITSDDVEGDDPANLKKGDVIVFAFNGEGKIKQIDTVLSADDIGGDPFAYETVKANAANMKTKIVINPDMRNWTTAWSNKDDTTIDTSKDVTKLVFGPVIEKKDAYITLAQINGNKTDKTKDASSKKATELTEGGTWDINITDQTRVYKYDFSLDGKSRLANGVRGDIVASIIPNTAVKDEVIDWTNKDITANYVFAKVVDGYATDIYVILAK